MTNPYYAPSGNPSTQSRNLSATMRTEFESVEDGFDAVKTAVDLKAPLADATMTGTTSVANLSASGTISAAGGKVAFPATQSASSDPNTLDDYEEAIGSTGWVPADASGAGLSFTSVSAQYIKIGCVVFIQGKLTYPATASGSAAVLSGLPFAPRDAIISPASLTIGLSGAAFALNAYINGSLGSERIRIVKAIGGTAVLNSELTGQTIYFSGWYITA